MTLTSGKSVEEVCGLWQSRALREADGKMQRVLLAALRAEYPADLIVLLKSTFGEIDIPNPFYRGYATIVPTGRLVCEVVDRDGSGLVWRGVVKVYDSETDFVSGMRRLADKLKLSDTDRVDMFRVLQKWVTQDQRLDLNSEKRLAS